MASPAAQFLCPACQTPLPASPAGQATLNCPACLVEVDAARLETLVGKPRFVAERNWAGIEIDGIVVEDVIGAGGMGTVYRAHAVQDGQPLAVKFLSPSLAAESELLRRFAREAALLETLSHPGIVKVRAHGEAQGVPWFAMDLVDGPTLAARLEGGPLSLLEARTIFQGLLGALAYAHAHGIVHRDLKPANVLLAPDGARLADFGIAHLDWQGSTAKTQLTRTAAVLGTFPYMSPEQRAGRAVDARSDLYAVGVMLYEALTGRRPEGAFPPMRRARAEIPSGLDRLVLQLLQPEPDARVASAERAGQMLTTALARPVRRTAVMVTAGIGACVLAALLVVGGRDKPAAEAAKSPQPEPAKVQRVEASQAPPQAVSPAQEGPSATSPAPALVLDGKKPAPAKSKSPGKVAPSSKIEFLMRKAQPGGFGENEPFLDSNNAQPAPLQQQPPPVVQQPIPLLKQAKRKNATDDRTAEPATKSGGRAFKSGAKSPYGDDFDLLRK
jgi:serine/threonine protein kinase